MILKICRSASSKGMAKAINLIAISTPFEHTKNYIKDLLYINVSETLIKEVNYAIGNNIAIKAEEEISEKDIEENTESKEEIDIIYLHADGAMVPIAGEGKREFKENKLGLVYTSNDISQKISKNAKERIEIKNKRFANSLGEGVDKFKKIFYNIAKSKGLDRAKKVIFLCDGAIWLRKLKEEYFPEAIQILDWYHAVEHLWGTAHKLFGENNKKKCEEWVEPLETLLWEGKTDSVLKIIREQAFKKKKNQTPLWELHGYYTSNRDMMKYDKYRESGYFIGSGSIESANNYIVANRIKSTGMRWKIERANAMIWMRCKYFEDQWQEFWDEMDYCEFMKKSFQDMPVAA